MRKVGFSCVALHDDLPQLPVVAPQAKARLMHGRFGYFLFACGMWIRFQSSIGFWPLAGAAFRARSVMNLTSASLSSESFE